MSTESKNNIKVLLIALDALAGIILLTAAYGYTENEEGIRSPLTYVYYQNLRWIVCGLSVWHIFRINKVSKKSPIKGRLIWVILFCILAIIFNPFIPLQLTKEIWGCINLFGSVVFVSAIFLLIGRE